MLEHMAAARRAEGRAAWSEALAEYERAFYLLPSGGSAELAAQLLRSIGHVRRQCGEIDLAREAFDASAAIADAAGLPVALATALNALGVIEHFEGRPAAAGRYYERARVLAMEAGDAGLTALIAQNLGTLADITGDAHAAIAAYSAVVQSCTVLGDRARASGALVRIGDAYRDLQQWAEAETALDEAFRLADLERDGELLGSVEYHRASLYLHKGLHAVARDYCDRAFELFSRDGSQLRIGETLRMYGMLFAAMGRPGLADEHFSRASAIAAACEYRLLEAEICSEWAKLHLEEGRTRDALRQLNSAYRLTEELHSRREVVDAERRMTAIEATYLEVIRRWAESVEAADLYTAGHCERVADYTCRMAAALGFGPRELAWIRMGGYLHDVGKINVPAAVLNKPGKLDAAEWQLVQQHTADGYDIVADLNLPFEIAPMVRSHHERVDGCGYPDRLAGDAIPLTARILFVADVFDALTTARSYRPALAVSEALRIMEKDVGTAFDEDVFACFRAILAQRRTSFAPLVGRPA